MMEKADEQVEPEVEPTATDKARYFSSMLRVHSYIPNYRGDFLSLSFGNGWFSQRDRMDYDPDVIYDMGGITAESIRNKLVIGGDYHDKNIDITANERSYINSVEELVNENEKPMDGSDKLFNQFGSFSNDDQLLRITTNEYGLNVITSINRKILVHVLFVI